MYLLYTADSSYTLHRRHYKVLTSATIPYARLGLQFALADANSIPILMVPPVRHRRHLLPPFKNDDFDASIVADGDACVVPDDPNEQTDGHRRCI